MSDPVIEVIDGETALPPGFEHPHASEAGRLIAERGTILRAQVGSGVHGHTNRPELVAVHGYDTKFAMHALRLGVQGVELLTTGRITLPVPDPDRQYLRAVRRGEVEQVEVVNAVEAAERKLESLRASTGIPAEPDRDWVNGWLHRSYTNYWSTLS